MTRYSRDDDASVVEAMSDWSRLTAPVRSACSGGVAGCDCTAGCSAAGDEIARLFAEALLPVAEAPRDPGTTADAPSVRPD